MKIVVTGGGGFVGSHVCEYYAKHGHEVIALDNLSRAKLLKKKKAGTLYNWRYLSQFSNVKRVITDITRFASLKKWFRGAHVVIHTASQTAVTTSVLDPATDFRMNAIGTFQVLEAARQTRKPPAVVICSTNKVYGDNVNQLRIQKKRSRYIFTGKYKKGVSETLGIDLCKHTPYGCSKLTSDVYGQDYARLYGLKVGIFRMSCIYGTRQFGVEDQGWLAWFIIAAMTGKPVTIFGDGRQVRDVLWVSDLVGAFDAFLKSKHRHVVVNVGGGLRNTLSLLELIDILKAYGYHIRPKFKEWRPSDQKVYISNIQRAKQMLHWGPKVSPRRGIAKLVNWISDNRKLF